MLRTTVYLHEDIALALRQLAERQERPHAEIIRDALGKYVQARQKLRAKPKIPGIGAYRSGRKDVSQKAEEIRRQAARTRR
jgi:predicted transcriptional regulator